MRNKLKIKICGMCYPENISEVLQFEPDYLGFIFFKRSPRAVNEDIVNQVKFTAATKKVAVFVNEQPDFVADIIRKQKFEAVQLHGDESEYYIAQLRKKFPQLMIIKAFRISENFDFSLLESYKSVDFFLFDNYQANKLGGTGEVFNWNLLKEYLLPVPYFLSGGLRLEHIEMIAALAAQDTRLYGADFNSGLEIEPGKKDLNLVNKLFERINV